MKFDERIIEELEAFKKTIRSAPLHYLAGQTSLPIRLKFYRF